MFMVVESPSEILGYVSIAFWLCAQFPQIVENIKQQSCESLALPFLFNWMLGDVSNLIGCLLTDQLPFQTYLATYFCFIDCCLLFQYFYYGGGPKYPPIVYHTRSRTTSSTGRHSVDASHYCTLYSTVGNVSTYSETYPEHRRPKKFVGELPADEQSDAQIPPGEPQDEVSDAVLSALSESFYSESGRRKRVSWSQERLEHLSGSSSRRHMSPVVSATLRHTPAVTAALLARGRPLQRSGEVDDQEGILDPERRDTSRASRRSAGMVLLGAGILFGIGRSMSVGQPIVGRGVKTGAVLVPGPVSHQLVSTGSSILENLSNHVADLSPSYINVELPSTSNDAELSHQQHHKGSSYQRIVGRISAWLCTVLYLTSRLPQIWKNYVRKSVEGLSIYLFIFAFLGNFFYVMSIVTAPAASLPPPVSTEFFRESLPYLLGSGGTFVFDIAIVTQSFIYRGKHPRRSYIRSRGNSIVRSAALAEETAGLLRGDTLAGTRARLERARSNSVVVPRSLSRN